MGRAAVLQSTALSMLYRRAVQAALAAEALVENSAEAAKRRVMLVFVKLILFMIKFSFIKVKKVCEARKIIVCILN